MSASSGHSHSGIDSRILKEAAQWLTRLQTDGLDDGARAEWQRWKGSSSEHAQAWEKAERLLGMLSAVPPEMKSTLDRPARLSRRQLVKAAVATAFIGSGTWLGYRSYDGSLGATYATDVGQTQTVALAGGVTLALNTDSAVKVEQDEATNFIRLLRGEILVDTDRARPSAAMFTVATDDGWLRLQDARVNIRRRSSASEAIVLRGNAQFVAAGRATGTPLRSLQRAWFEQGRITRVTAVEDASMAWVDGVIFADDMRLADFLDEVSRYRHGYIVCDPAVADLRISGSFQVRDTQGILSTLQNTLPVNIVFRTQYWVAVGPRASGRVHT